MWPPHSQDRDAYLSPNNPGIHINTELLLMSCPLALVFQNVLNVFAAETETELQDA